MDSEAKKSQIEAQLDTVVKMCHSWETFDCANCIIKGCDDHSFAYVAVVVYENLTGCVLSMRTLVAVSSHMYKPHSSGYCFKSVAFSQHCQIVEALQHSGLLRIRNPNHIEP